MRSPRSSGARIKRSKFSVMTKGRNVVPALSFAAAALRSKRRGKHCAPHIIPLLLRKTSSISRLFLGPPCFSSSPRHVTNCTCYLTRGGHHHEFRQYRYEVPTSRAELVSLHHRPSFVSVWRCEASKVSARFSVRQGRTNVVVRSSRQHRTDFGSPAYSRSFYAPRGIHPLR